MSTNVDTYYTEITNLPKNYAIQTNKVNCTSFYVLYF